ncbi:MAG: hypothetical protein KQH83_04340 [Actinobacteria bacterium]|nr:hypothetical protein [Actinomycetota bacterium]
MRIALHADGEVGRRTGRILLAEAGLTALGMYGQAKGAEDRRTTGIRTLAGYDPLATDAPDARSFALIAAEEGVSCVLAALPRVDRRLRNAFLDRGLTLLVGADLAGGIAETLAAHEMAVTEHDTEVTIAWTVPGRPVRRGEAIPFPDPVGPRWAARVGKAPRRRTRRASTVIRRFEAPVSGDWAGALARVRGERRGTRVEQVVGVADQAAHLGAIALAAGALAVAAGAYPPGVHAPAVNAGAYLDTALRIGLGVASHTRQQ